ncbi:MAG: alpha/beta fold hydrolase [Thermoanaerobaculia bacterium]
MPRPPELAAVRSLILGLGAFLFGMAASGNAMARPAARARAPLALEPCEIPGLQSKARCGTYPVYENRATKRGRKIGLKIVVLPATGGNQAPDPFVFLNGGPGESATEAAAGLAQGFAKIRERRDIVLVDQRGTGGSHPLNCNLFLPADNLQSYLGDFFPPGAIRQCRAELERDADLTLYTTPVAMDDLDDVRAALGYERLNLFGGSYGTRAALVYLRQHPTHVRTLTLQGVAPMQDYMPLEFPRSAQRALDGVLEECLTDAVCHAAFPALREEVGALFDRLAQAPVSVEILNPETATPATVTLSRDLAAETIRYMLYQAGAATQMPAFVHQTAQGDFTPLAEFALFGRREIVASGAAGLYLSITCAEDLPWIRPGEGERAAKGTFLSDYRLKQQRAACELWPRASIPPGYSRPVRSRVPALILSGAWDPVTPPSNGSQVAKYLPRSLHLIVPHGGHSYEGLEGLDCIERLQTEFVERGTTSGLDAGCVAQMRRPPFPVKAPDMKLVAMTEAELSRFAGPYVGERDPIDAKAELVNGRLKMVLPGGRVFLLAPVSGNRFRIAGAPTVYVSFDISKGRVERAVVEEGGTPVLTLVPKGEAGNGKR